MCVAVTIHLTGTEGKADAVIFERGVSVKERSTQFEPAELLRQRMTQDFGTLVRGMSASGTGLNVCKWRSPA